MHERAAIRLHAQRPRARLDLLCRRQLESQRRLQAALRRQLDRLHARLRHADAVLRACHPERRVALLRQRLQSLSLRPQAALARRLQHDTLRLRGLARSLETVSPLATVARGYAILQREDGRVVRSVGSVDDGERLLARLPDGRLPVRVEKD